jgi:murein DD-endopeptidase MepM/ murein hydrolase activator NlpD
MRIIPRLVGGKVVEGSLLQTLVGLSLPRDMVRKLCDAFDWSVDFFELEPEDEVRVHAFERLAGDSTIGIDRLDGAVIVQGKEKHYAFAWHYHGQLHYLNEKGEFLRRRFLRSPLDYAEISSGFSYSRFHPIMHRFQPHLGIDYVAPVGSPVRAVADGRVKESGFKGGNGLYVKLEHGEHETGYLHLKALGEGINPGMYVRQGQVIGYLGSSGLSTGPHLCFRYWRNGSPANPDLISFNAGPALKLPEPELSRYLETIVTLRNRLDEFQPVPVNNDPIGF